MEHPKKKKHVWLWIVLPLLLVLLVAGGVGFSRYQKNEQLRQSAEQTYADAMERLNAEGFAALSAGDAAIGTLRQNPFGQAWIDPILQKQAELSEAEVARLIAENEPDAAEALLNKSDIAEPEPYRAQIAALRTANAYAEAEALEAAGKDAEALAAFTALGTYADAEARAATIRARIDFADAKAVFTGENYEEAIAALLALQTDEANAEAAALQAQWDELLAQKRLAIRNASSGRLSAGAWHTALLGETPQLYGDARYSAAPAEADRVFSGLASVFFVKNGAVVSMNETYGEEATIAALSDIAEIAAGPAHGLFLRENGRVVGVGSKAYGRTAVNDWDHITAVAAGAWHSVGLQRSQNVLACGNNDHGQCDVTDWEGIVSVKAGLWHTVGLKADGTVVACGDNAFGQCDVAQWTDIVAIECGACCTVGLKADGTAVACGDNSVGQCDIADWTELAAIATGGYHTVGLRLDGTLLVAGSDRNGQAQLPERLLTNDWTVSTVNESRIVDAAPAEYIEGEGTDLGPWFYCDQSGAAMICLDDSEERMPFRTDLLATSSAIPTGRVTTPDATGKEIRMAEILPAEQARSAQAVIAFTGDYVGFTANRKGVMIRNGVTYYDRDETTTLAILPDGTLQLYEKGETSAAALLEMGVRDSFSFGPLLAKDGAAVPIEAWRDNVYTMRVAFGYSDPYHYVVVVGERDREVQLRFSQLAAICGRYGCRLAYNLDGGHSTSLVFMGKELSLVTLRGVGHGNIRGLSDVIVFLQNDRVGQADTAE